METIFYNHLKKYPDRLELYNEARKNRKISEFDLELLSKLKKTVYGGIPGNIYLYAFPTNFETIGNKLEILAWAYRDKKYKLVHGNTNSTKEIMFHEYDSKHLDYNSWMEVKIGLKEYVIDTFSMLMFEKDIYYQLENPQVLKVVTSEDINNHPARCDDDFSEAFASYDSLLMLMDTLEYLTNNSPYKDYLIKELDKLKSKIDYDKMIQEYLQETGAIFNNKK